MPLYLLDGELLKDGAALTTSEGCCCFECGLCCADTDAVPAGMTVTVAGVTAGDATEPCDSCDSINDTYTLSVEFPVDGDCGWKFEDSWSCGATDCDYISAIIITATLKCNGDTPSLIIAFGSVTIINGGAQTEGAQIDVAEPGIPLQSCFTPTVWNTVLHASENDFCCNWDDVTLTMNFI